MMPENQKLKILLSSEDLESKEEEARKRNFAVQILLKNIENGSEWFQKQTLQLLFFYRDLPMVQNRLQSWYDTLNVESPIRTTLEEFFAGSLDVSKILEQRQKQLKLEKQMRQIRADLESEKNQEQEAYSTFSQLGLLSLKQG